MTNTNIKIEILEKALENAKQSAMYFNWFRQDKNETYWAITMEYDGKASAYLDCYKMLTGKKIINVKCDIEKELDAYKPNFRLTIGENGTAFGKQKVLIEGRAANELEFTKEVIFKFAPDDIVKLINNAWIDSGSDTIPIAVQNLKLF